LDILANQGITPSFQVSQYRTWVNAILQQFTGCDGSVAKCPGGWTGAINGTLSYSTSGKTVANIISTFKNDADFLSLQAAFEIRTYDDCGVWPFNGSVKNVTLSGAINNELITCEIEGLNKILASKNITYKF